MTVFHTERLDVGLWEPADRDRCHDLYRRWEVVRFLGRTKALESVEEADAAIARLRGRCADPRFGAWAVRVRETGDIAGTILLVPIPGGDGEVEVGWHFHPDSWGNGYATEAARGALDKGFAEGLSEVFSVVNPANGPSLAVCRRLGMTPLGLTERWYESKLESFRITPDQD